MSLSPQTQKRLPKIKTGLLIGLNYTEIGQNCGVTEKTIDRDIQAWYQTGQYESWLWQEWLRLHALVLKEDVVEPYRQVTKLIGRMVTRKAEVKTTEEIHEEITFNFNELSEDERNFCRKIARHYIQRNNKTRSASIH